jgi:hypothetical protein
MQKLDHSKISFEEVCKKNRNYLKRRHKQIMSLPYLAWQYEGNEGDEPCKATPGSSNE